MPMLPGTTPGTAEYTRDDFLRLSSVELSQTERWPNPNFKVSSGYTDVWVRKLGVATNSTISVSAALVFTLVWTREKTPRGELSVRLRGLSP